MTTLTSFERQALDCMAPLFGGRADAFRKQLASVNVISRENTGVGFYTRVSVDRDRVATLEFAQQSAHFHVDGIEGGLSLVLSGDADGFLSDIEGVTFGDDQLVGVDLDSLRFAGVAQLS